MTNIGLTFSIFPWIAVGSIFGWRLAQHPRVRVSVVCRSNYERIHKDGVQIDTQIWGHGTFRPHRVVKSVTEVQHVPFEYIICANKNVRSTKTTVVDAIRPAVRPATVLVTVQNGINVEQPLKNAFPRNTVLSAICYVSCQQIRPGLVQQTAQIRPYAFGIGILRHKAHDMKSTASKIQNLASLDTKFEEAKDIDTESWAKMVFNGSWNPVAALTGCDTHQILQDPISLALVQHFAEEICQVAGASSVKLPLDLPLRTRDSAARASPLVPSMLQDSRNGREMEVEPLCGELSCSTIPRDSKANKSKRQYSETSEILGSACTND